MFRFTAVLLMSLSIAIHSMAKEEQEAPAEGRSEAGVVTPMSPWLSAENKVQELSAKIKSKRGQIEDLLIEKHHAKEDSPEVSHIVANLMKEHKELSSLIEDYEKNLNLLKYRFPERSAKSDRQYQKIEMKSLGEIENDLGVDGKLSRNLQRMRTHYGTTNPAKARIPASTGSKKGVQKNPEGSIENPEPIIIKK